MHFIAMDDEESMKVEKKRGNNTKGNMNDLHPLTFLLLAQLVAHDLLLEVKKHSRANSGLLKTSHFGE